MQSFGVQKEHGQQVEGADPPSLFCPGVATSRVLCPALRSLVQERERSYTENPTEGHKGD